MCTWHHDIIFYTPLQMTIMHLSMVSPTWHMWGGGGDLTVVVFKFPLLEHFNQSNLHLDIPPGQAAIWLHLPWTSLPVCYTCKPPQDSHLYTTPTPPPSPSGHIYIVGCGPTTALDTSLWQDMFCCNFSPIGSNGFIVTM